MRSDDKLAMGYAPHANRHHAPSGGAPSSYTATPVTTTTTTSVDTSQHQSSLNRLFGINKSSPLIRKRAKKPQSCEQSFQMQEKMRYAEMIKQYSNPSGTFAKITHKISSMFKRTQQNILNVNNLNNYKSKPHNRPGNTTPNDACLLLRKTIRSGPDAFRSAGYQTPLSSTLGASKSLHSRHRTFDGSLMVAASPDTFARNITTFHPKSSSTFNYSSSAPSRNDLPIYYNNRDRTTSETIVIDDDSDVIDLDLYDNTSKVTIIDDDIDYNTSRRLLPSKHYDILDEEDVIFVSMSHAKDIASNTSKVHDYYTPEVAARQPLRPFEYSKQSCETTENREKFDQTTFINTDWINNTEAKILKSRQCKKEKILGLQHKTTHLKEKRTAPTNMKNFHRFQLNENWETLITERIQHRLNIAERIPPVYKEEPLPPILVKEVEEDEAEEEVEEILVELSDGQQAEISRAFERRNTNNILVEGFKMQLKGHDIVTLSGLNWLNDEVINFYMNMLMERGSPSPTTACKPGEPTGIHAFNSFFYPKLKRNGHASVKRWTKRIDVLANKFILVPIHLGVHWCLAVINFHKKSIDYYDSMGSTNDVCLTDLRQYIVDEALEKKNEVLDVSDWTLNNLVDIPQQMNGSDCGMFLCKFAEYATREVEPTFTQENMPYFRRRMVWEILNKTLL